MAFTVQPPFEQPDLADLLSKAGVDPAKWPMKSVGDVLEELRAGESELVLARLVSVVKMNVFSADCKRRLVETGKEEEGKFVAHRHPRSPAGKRRSGEDWPDALTRELKEELRLVGREMYLARDRVPKPSPEIEDSRSCPGILGVYDISAYEVWLTKAGEQVIEQFKGTEEGSGYAIPDLGSPGTILHFTWVPSDS